jgi:hypothetical protein
LADGDLEQETCFLSLGFTDQTGFQVRPSFMAKPLPTLAAIRIPELARNVDAPWFFEGWLED